MRDIWLVATLLFLLPALIASAQDDASVPPATAPTANGRLVVRFEDSGQIGEQRLSAGGQLDVPFGGPLYFFYGVKRPAGTRNTAGALAVKVARLYEHGDSGDWKYANWTVVDRRTGFVQRATPFIDEILRARYRGYHDNTIYSGMLDMDFHAEFVPGEKTNEPLARRTSFLFDSFLRDDALAARKTVLYHYSGSGQDGAWIRFQVNADQAFSEMRIAVVDLGRNIAGAPEQRSWTIRKR